MLRTSIAAIQTITITICIMYYNFKIF